MRGPSIVTAVVSGAAMLVALLAHEAAAQHPAFGRPDPRPLHERLANADAVAFATVGEVRQGRIEVSGARGVWGAVPNRFALKRAPSTPPNLAPGDRALLLLIGARTPYLLASAPHEQVRLGGSEDEAAWAAGLRALRSAGADGAPLVGAYAAWLDATPLMQREAARGLAHEDCPATALSPELAARLATHALSGDDAELRHAATRAALRSAEGRDRLLAALPGDDPGVLVTTLAAAGVRSDAARATLLRALRHDEGRVRRAALPFARSVANDRAIRVHLVRIAGEDPEPGLRDEARRIMKNAASR